MRAILAVLFVALFSVAFGFSCKDQSNRDVDWFAVYKMPVMSGSSMTGLSSGHAFYYMDVNKKQFEASGNGLDSSDQAIAHTLKQLYDNKKHPEVLYVNYNDEEIEPDLEELADELSVQFGHTKGVVLFDKTEGFWLVHSVPKFPPIEEYSYPSSGTQYAQSMLCLSLKYSMRNSVGTQLLFNHPKLWDSWLPTAMASENPEFQELISGKYKSGSPSSSVVQLTSKGGHKFVSFAKSADFGKDLYDGLVATHLQAPLDVETWRRGSPISLDCGARYRVLDCLEMEVGSHKFKYTKDHSKIAISTSQLEPFVCIGDVNRMTSQYKRGGGTVCISDQFVWDVYSKLTVETNSC